MEIVIIAAVAENGVIGKDGDLPWHYPEDFEFFKEETLGFPVIMGRVTYEGIAESLGGPLPGRKNIVLSREELDLEEGAVNVHGIEKAIEEAEETGKERAYVGGGGSVYRQFLEQGLVDEMVITEIPESPEGDTRFPDWDEDDWEEVERQERGELEIVRYVRN
ncbi:MAG: dihydrofolate reductase [Candidatus Nanohaloarchaea archaeon]|nr:dihydrofolate reductase [Candidatus Nanohaloarchaea archaeon]